MKHPIDEKAPDFTELEDAKISAERVGCYLIPKAEYDNQVHIDKDEYEELQKHKRALLEIDRYRIDWSTGLDENISRVTQIAFDALNPEIK